MCGQQMTADFWIKGIKTYALRCDNLRDLLNLTKSAVQTIATIHRCYPTCYRFLTSVAMVLT